jgi:hypothetical protein
MEVVRSELEERLNLETGHLFEDETAVFGAIEGSATLAALRIPIGRPGQRTDESVFALSEQQFPQ